ncbi:MAG: hypothetical protein JNM96_02655, partial [Bacteroidia bacterium]|nr:hypothetical protein [Bacteroidia bacterium]
QTKVSRYEYAWAFAHPFAACKVKKIHKKLKPFYNESELKMSLDSFSQGGKLDAYRHVFYMAAFAQKIKAKKIIKLGKAHEKTNYRQFKKGKGKNTILPDSLSSIMDLWNNEIGVTLARDNKELSYEELKHKVIKLINENKAFYFLRDANGNFLDCDGKTIIDLKKYQDKWYIPKCMLGLSEKQENIMKHSD